MALVTNSVHFVDSDVNTHFTAAIAGTVGASTYADIQVAEGTQAALGAYSKLLIKSIRLLAMENRKYRLDFYERSVPVATPSIVANGLLGSVELTVPGGAQPSAYYATAYTIATLFAYIAENLDIPYHDKTAQGQLHVNLVAVGSDGKSAGSAGAVHLRVGTIAAS